MSRGRSLQIDLLERIHNFVVDGECNELADDHWNDFERLLRENADARKAYVEYMGVSAVLRSVMDAMPDEDTHSPAVFSPELNDCAAPTFPATLWQGTVNYFSSGWPLAYLIATVLFTAGLLVGHLTPKSQPVQVTRTSSPERSRSLSEPEVQSVGRITGMVDCRWGEGAGAGGRGTGDGKVGSGQWAVGNGQNISKSRNPQIPKSLVHLGDKFALASGLLEITYDTGAKVILQGPVTYEVEAPASGFLSIGKLTAKVAKNDECRMMNDESRTRTGDIHHSSFIIHHLFSVRTPTATVTDLGTEFGVEVRNADVTIAHVFRGEIEVRSSAQKGQPVRTVRLRENEAAQIERRTAGGATTIKVVSSSPVDAVAFVRVDQLRKLAEEPRPGSFPRWHAYSQELCKDPSLVAYYTFESAGANNTILPNRSATSESLDAHVDGAEWVYGRWPDKFALYFRGPGAENKVVLPKPELFTFTTPFSIAVWFQTSPFPFGAVPSLIEKGGTAWRLQRWGTDGGGLTLDTNSKPVNGRYYAMPPPHINVTDGKWHLAVAVVEPGANSYRKRFYVDGRLEGDVTAPAALERNDAPVWIGQSSYTPGRDFQGRIDEVAFFSRVLSVAEVEAMFDAGNPAPGRQR